MMMLVYQKMSKKKVSTNLSSKPSVRDASKITLSSFLSKSLVYPSCGSRKKASYANDAYKLSSLLLLSFTFLTGLTAHHEKQQALKICCFLTVTTVETSGHSF